MILENISPPSWDDMKQASGISKKAARDWENYCKGCRRRFSVVRGIVNEKFSGRFQGKTFLDWGSAAGGVAMLMQSEFPITMHAADVDVHSMAWLSRTRPDIRCSVLTPGKPLPFADDTFDFIYGISVLTHIPPALQAFYLEELRRIAKKDGLVVLTVKGYASCEDEGLKSKNPKAHLHDTALLRQQGIVHRPYSDATLKRLDFASDGNYGMTYHSREYVEQVFGQYFVVEAIREGNMGKQDVILLQPRSAVLDAVIASKRDDAAPGWGPVSAIWITSYPKSGNTWVQSVMRQVGQPFGFPRSDLDVYKLIRDMRTPVAVGGIRPDVSNAKTTVLKTHSRHFQEREIHPELNLKTVGFVYVMRNPLDLLLSYINFTRMQYEKRKDSERYRQALFIDLLGYDRPIPYEEWVNSKLEDIPRSNLDHALNRFTELETVIPGIGMAGGSWLDHTRSWHEAGKTLPSVFLKYEDLLRGAEYFLPLSKLFTFSDSEILDAVDAINRQQRDKQYKKIFFNKMSAYYYPNFFSADAIGRFLGRFESDLKQLGYDDLPEHA